MVPPRVPRRPSRSLLRLVAPSCDVVWPAQPGHERLDGGEDPLTVTDPRIMVNSGQFDELTVRGSRVPGSDCCPPTAIRPLSADHQRQDADLTEHGADVEVAVQLGSRLDIHGLAAGRI